MPADRPVLQTWKEIAGYLDVSVRTVQLWEHEKGLPVHRGEGHRPRVWADPAELDKWRDKIRLEGDKTSRPNRRWPIVAVAGLVVITLGIIGYRPFSRCHPVSVVVEMETLSALDSAGRPCWADDFPGLDAAADYKSGRKNALSVVDTDRDGENEVLFAYSTDKLDGLRQLVLVESDGTIKWRFNFGRKLVVSDGFSDRRTLANRYLPGFVTFVPGKDRDYILATAEHVPLYPTQVALLDPATGKLLDEYWHPGRIQFWKWKDLDGDGQPEALFGGTNNPGPGVGHAAFVVLPIPFRNQTLENSGAFFPGQNRKEYFYGLLPDPDVYRVLAAVPRIYLISEAGDNLRLWIDSPQIHGGLEYVLSPDLRLLRTIVEDPLRQAHAMLRLQSGLDHHLTLDEERTWAKMLVLPTAPDGNSPAIEELFDGAPTCDGTTQLPCLMKLSQRDVID